LDEQAQLELLGKRIREAREQLGLSQEDFGAKISRTQFAVSEYENGKRRIYAHDLPKIARVLQVSINYFFDETDEADASEEIILRAFRNLPSTKAKHIATNIMNQLSELADNPSTE
jgi:transcriptional regulator with XRE-family HTH domain